MLLLALSSFLSFFKKKQISFNTKPSTAVGLIFFTYILSGVYSSNFDFFFERIRIALPLLLLAISFQKISLKKFEKILLIFLFLVLIQAIVATTKFIIFHKSFDILFHNGTLFPLPIHHVRFSLMVSLAIFISFFFLKKTSRKKKRFKFLLLIASFLLIFLHLLAVRSGILGFYFALCFVFYKYGFFTRKKNLKILISASLISCFIIFCNCYPALSNKIKTTTQSIQSIFQNDEIYNLSDYGRIASISAGIDAGKSNPFLGVGLGDLKDSCKEYFKTNYPDLEHTGLLPHNQFVYVFAFSGIVGLGWFIYAFFNFHFNQKKSNFLFDGFSIIILCSFFFDHTLETQIGMAFYIIFSLLLNPENCENIK